MSFLPKVNFCCDVYCLDKKTGRIEIIDGKLVKNEDYVHSVFHYPFPSTSDFKVIAHCLAQRVICQDRFTPEVQKHLGLSEYNVYDILRITHGVDTDDFIWFKFDDEDITWEDVKVRRG